MERKALPVVLILVLLVLSVDLGCGGESGNNIFTVEDAAGIIEIEHGETFIVKLEENPSTGYNWHWTVGPEGVVVLDSEEFIAAEDEEVVGVPGRHEFVFRAEEAGEAEVVFQYYRDWEPENIAETHVFKLIVK
ncbi:MAG: protease inhibitor I42 family protein [Bacillota bacterium]|nr:protease inhibitor I42 family protein [Bacillota bacterium]